VATLGPDGALTSAPAWVAPPIGQQALVSVTSAPDGRSKRGPRGLGERRPDVGRRARHPPRDRRRQGGRLEGARAHVVRRRGLARGSSRTVTDSPALTVAPATASDDAASPGAPTPTLVRLGADLSVRWAEPIRFAQAPSEDGVPAFALEPACAEGACYALAADGPGPLSYYAVSSAERQSPWRAPVWKGDEERAPKVVELRSITEGPRLAGAYATRLAGEGAPEAVAVGHLLPRRLDGDGARRPKGEPPYAATLAVRFTQADGALSAPVEISKRALSVGGVSVTPAAAAKRPEAVVAWGRPRQDRPPGLRDQGRRRRQEGRAEEGDDGHPRDEGQDRRGGAPVRVQRLDRVPPRRSMAPRTASCSRGSTRATRTVSCTSRGSTKISRRASPTSASRRRPATRRTSASRSAARRSSWPSPTRARASRRTSTSPTSTRSP
jgi:hypothetical protein